MTSADQPGVYLTQEEFTALVDEVKILNNAGIVEIAVRNTQVMEYMQHWEGRAEKAEAERDRLREESETQKKYRAQHWLRRNLEAHEDAEIKVLCDKYGYGAVMDAASRLWARTPYGSGAFYVGGCIGVWTDDEARAALKGDQT